ncbi:PIN domain-containing protein [Campylobacter helveticus]|uniref:PIN domain-containing protein n=1 Tax=Campylobacter helveticus TaxID=28898 RepID=UPI00214A043B|nr:PIN domain-containing protein [Campylobacter helveticus]MCR2064406.1 PIN domain-containing protein [Campylobacter helveticus]
MACIKDLENYSNENLKSLQKELENIDFVDALICAKCKLQNYKKLSFDKDLNGC